MSMEIRMADVRDAEELLEIYRPYVLETAITFEYEVPSVEEFQQRMERVLQKYPYLAAVEDGEIVGYAYASPFHVRAAYDWCVEVSVYVEMSQKRKGYGKKLYLEMEKFLKKQHVLNINACISYTDQEDEYLTNDSMRFHEHIGYEMVGRFHQCGYKFGKWYDMIWMEKFLGEHVDNPELVLSIIEIKTV